MNKQIPIEEGLFVIPDDPEEKPYLIGSKCTRCGAVYFPKVHICARCCEWDTIVEIRLHGEGTIDTFCIVQSALPGFQSPSIQAYIQLKEGPKIWGLITDNERLGQDLQIGMKVELVISKVKEDAEGNDIISYLFKPLRDT